VTNIGNTPFVVVKTSTAAPGALRNRRAGPGGPWLVNLTPRAFKLAPEPVSFAESGAAPIFPSHDAFRYRHAATPGCTRARRSGSSRKPGAEPPRPSWRRKGRGSWCCAVRVERRSRCMRGRMPQARPGCVRPRSFLIRRSDRFLSTLPLETAVRSRVTAVGERFAVRVMVTDAVGSGVSRVEPTTTVRTQAPGAAQALKRAQVRPEDYVVKFRGAQVLDETTTVAALGAGPTRLSSSCPPGANRCADGVPRADDLHGRLPAAGRSAARVQRLPSVAAG